MADQTTAKLATKRGSTSHQLNPHYYAFYLGPALVLSINMEVYVALYNDTLNENLRKEQETWMNDRLRAANTPEERKKHPWIIVLGHQPLYCSSSRQDGSCTTDAEQVSTFLCVFKGFIKSKYFFVDAQRFGGHLLPVGSGHRHRSAHPQLRARVSNVQGEAGRTVVQRPLSQSKGPSVHCLRGRGNIKALIENRSKKGFLFLTCFFLYKPTRDALRRLTSSSSLDLTGTPSPTLSLATAFWRLLTEQRWSTSRRQSSTTVLVTT